MPHTFRVWHFWRQKTIIHRYMKGVKGSFLVLEAKTIISFCKVLERTSRESRRRKQNWTQGKVHRSRRNRRWSPTKSFSGTAQILNLKVSVASNICDALIKLTKHCWVSEEDVHNSNIFLIGIVGHLSLTFGNLWWLSAQLDWNGIYKGFLKYLMETWYYRKIEFVLSPPWGIL